MGSTIQVLTAAAPPPPLAAGPLPLDMAPPPTHVALYEGDVLDLSSQTSTSLFQNGCAALASKRTGKVEDLHLFLADICNHAQTCHWNATGHAILSFTIVMDTLNLIEDYGKLTPDQVETTCIAGNAYGADL